MQNSVLFFGGSSDERLVSAASAQNLCQRYEFSKIWYLTPRGAVHEIAKSELLAHKDPFTQEFFPQSAVPLANDLRTALRTLQDTTVFMGFHGTEGENGEMQAVLEELRIPFTGSGSVSSRQCFDKLMAKKIVKAQGIHVTEELAVDPQNPETFESLKMFFNKHGKIVLKPIANGSSIGLYIVDSPNVLAKAMEEISKQSLAYLAEKFITGRECTVGVIKTPEGLQALPASEVILQAGRNFDYTGKYLGQGTTEVTPAEVTPEQMKSLQDVALKAHAALGCYGYSRTDVIMTAQEIIFLETNTLPGLTKASFIPQQLEAAGQEMPAFIQNQLYQAKHR